MHVRRYESGEEDRLWEICRDTTIHINGRDYSEEQVHAWGRADKDMGKWRTRIREKQPFVAIEGDEILGFIELSVEGQITAFYSHHAHQRQGIGQALYRHIEAEAKEARLDDIQVQSSITAQNFFLAQGFETVE